MNTRDHAALHADHRHWEADVKMWRMDIEEWQRDRAKLLAELEFALGAEVSGLKEHGSSDLMPEPQCRRNQIVRTRYFCLVSPP